MPTGRDFPDDAAGADAQEAEAGGHRLTVGAVAEGDRLPHRVGLAGDQRADRPGLAIWPGPGFLSALAGLAGRGHLEDRLGREHRRVGRDAQHVPAPGGVKSGAQLGLIAIGAVPEHRRVRNMPARRALDQLHSQLWLGLEHDVLRDLRLLATPSV